MYKRQGFNNNAFTIEHLGGTIYNHMEDPGGYGNIVTTYFDSQTSGLGSYVRFSGLTSNTFTVEATPVVGFSDITAINGIQVVGVPEPTTGVLGMLSAMTFILRRRRP